MGSQYIRDTTVRTSNKQEIKQDKTRNKKNKEDILTRFLGVYRYFTMVYWIFTSENGKFSTSFPTFSTMEEVDG